MPVRPATEETRAVVCCPGGPNMYRVSYPFSAEGSGGSGKVVPELRNRNDLWFSARTVPASIGDTGGTRWAGTTSRTWSSR